MQFLYSPIPTGSPQRLLSVDIVKISITLFLLNSVMPSVQTIIISIDHQMQTNDSLMPNSVFEMKKSRALIVEELQTFRRNPSCAIPIVKRRLTRYRLIDGTYYLFSNIHKKKAIQLSEPSNPEIRISEVTSVLEKKSLPMGQLQSISKLDEVASKICQTVAPQVMNSIQFKPETTKIIRGILDNDPTRTFPHNVVCLISLSFDEPNESLLTLLVDDDILDRKNREVLLDPKMKYFGLATMTVENYSYLRCTIILLTDEVVEKNENGKGSEETGHHIFNQKKSNADKKSLGSEGRAQNPGERSSIENKVEKKKSGSSEIKKQDSKTGVGSEKRNDGSFEEKMAKKQSNSNSSNPVERNNANNQDQHNPIQKKVSQNAKQSTPMQKKMSGIKSSEEPNPVGKRVSGLGSPDQSGLTNPIEKKQSTKSISNTFQSQKQKPEL